MTPRSPTIRTDPADTMIAPAHCHWTARRFRCKFAA
jgi:hypothetical protein